MKSGGAVAYRATSGFRSDHAINRSMPVDDAGGRRAQCTACLILQRQLKAKHCATRELLWCIPTLRVLRRWQHADGWACLNAANGPLLRAFTESDPGRCFATRPPCQQFRSLRGCGVCRVVHAANSENKWSGVECSLSAAVEPWILVVVLRLTLMVRARCTPIAPRFAGTSKTLPAALLQSARTEFERLSNSLCMRLPWIVSAIAPRVWCGSRPCNRAAFDLLSAWLSER
jgi:hypothetical protein